MKIGILTHPLRTNYGGILQNYALQQVLKNEGHEVFTIDWHDDKSYLYMVLSYVKRLIWHHLLRKTEIPTNFYINLTRSQFLYISKNIQEFITENINTTNYISSQSKLSIVNELGFDCIVVGSDQVWQEQFIPTMFLDFIKSNNVRMFSYAASFGKDKWECCEKKIELSRELVKRFAALSVREESGIKLCKNHLNANAELVLDPTLLLNNVHYQKLIKEEKHPVNKYCMVYVLDDSEFKRNIVQIVESERNISKYEVKSLKDYRCYSENLTLDYVVPPIEEWLDGIRNADFVVTDSFHGMVFSIIFNKEFLVIGNLKRGMARFESLLTKLELKHRLIGEGDDVKSKIKMMAPIDYTIVDEKIQELKSISLNYIHKSLS